MAATAPRPVIVAGVDGFNDSKEALRWAARQARLTGAEVHAVTAWHVPFRIYAMPSHNEADYARDARQTLDTAVRDALGPDPDVPVVTRLVQQRPAIALVEEAASADPANCRGCTWARWRPTAPTTRRARWWWSTRPASRMPSPPTGS